MTDDVQFGYKQYSVSQTMDIYYGQYFGAAHNGNDWAPGEG